MWNDLQAYDKYIKPVLSNMDKSTADYVQFSFYKLYKWNPQTMLRVKNKQQKQIRIRQFYWYVFKSCYCNDLPVTVKVHDNSEMQKLQEQLSRFTFCSLDDLLKILTAMASVSEISSSLRLPQQKNTKHQLIARFAQFVKRQH